MKSVWQKIFSWTRWRQWIFYPISDVDVINKCYIWQPIILSVRFCIQCVLNDVSTLGCLLNCFNVLDFYSYKRLYKSTDSNTSIISHQHILNDVIFFIINLQYEIKKNKPLLTFFFRCCYGDYFIANWIKQLCEPLDFPGIQWTDVL